MKPAFEDTLPVDAPAGGKPAFEDTLPMDQQGQDQGSYWDDVATNAGKEVTGMVKSAPALVDTAFKIGSIPDDFVKVPGEMLTGTPLRNTSLANDLSTAGNLAKTSIGIDGQGNWNPGQSPTAQMAKGMWQTVTSPKESFRQRPISTLGDAATIFGGGMALADRAMPAIANVADAGAMSMGRRALGFSKRFLNTEGKALNVDAATRTALDEGVIRPFSTPDTMMESAQGLQDKAGKTMGSIFDTENRGATRALSSKAAPQLREQFLFDTSKAIDDLEGLRPSAKGGRILRGGDYDAQNAAIDNAIDTIKAHGNRPIPWDEANQLKSHLQGLANYDTAASKTVNDLRKSIGGKFKDNLDAQLSGSMEAGGKDSSIFGKTKKTWKASEDMQEGLQNRISSEKGNNSISLADYAAGAAGNVASPVGGVVAIAGKKLFQKYGGTTGASALNKIANFAKEVPAVPSQFANTAKALGAGGVATKLITKDKAREFYIEAKRDADVARIIAKKRGYHGFIGDGVNGEKP